jgi:hypothetical protein
MANHRKASRSRVRGRHSSRERVSGAGVAIHVSVPFGCRAPAPKRASTSLNPGAAVLN